MGGMGTPTDESFKTTRDIPNPSLMKRRITYAPNMKNFKNLKQIEPGKSIEHYYEISEVLGKGSFG